MWLCDIGGENEMAFIVPLFFAGQVIQVIRMPQNHSSSVLLGPADEYVFLVLLLGGGDMTNDGSFHRHFIFKNYFLRFVSLKLLE